MPSDSLSSTSLGDPADGSRDKRNDDVSQYGDRLVAGQNQDRAATLICQLEPADLTACYKRSSRIASRALTSAQASSSDT
jgi:hypothetical protein